MSEGFERIRKQCDFERELQLGDKCIAHWTSCGYTYSHQVEVVKLNQKSFGVKLLEDVPAVSQIGSSQGGVDYPAGHMLNIPNFLNTNRWSWANRLSSCNLGYCVIRDTKYGGGPADKETCDLCGNKLMPSGRAG